MIYELLYNSVAAEFDTPVEDLRAILESSRRNNARLGITGLLVYHKGEFAQLLEGSEEAVRHLFYDVIAKDRRHRAARVSWEAPVAERGFAGWSMGFARGYQLPGADAGVLAGGLYTLDFTTPASLGRRVLLAFYEQMENSSALRC